MRIPALILVVVPMLCLPALPMPASAGSLNPLNFFLKRRLPPEPPPAPATDFTAGIELPPVAPPVLMPLPRPRPRYDAQPAAAPTSGLDVPEALQGSPVGLAAPIASAPVPPPLPRVRPAAPALAVAPVLATAPKPEPKPLVIAAAPAQPPAVAPAPAAATPRVILPAKTPEPQSASAPPPAPVVSPAPVIADAPSMTLATVQEADSATPAVKPAKNPDRLPDPEARPAPVVAPPIKAEPSITATHPAPATTTPPAVAAAETPELHAAPTPPAVRVIAPGPVATHEPAEAATTVDPAAPTPPAVAPVGAPEPHAAPAPSPVRVVAPGPAVVLEPAEVATDAHAALVATPAADTPAKSPDQHPLPTEPASDPDRTGPKKTGLGLPPYQMVRTLQSLQDQMAQGSVPALAAQRVLLAELDAEFMAADPSVWQDSRNAQAMIVLVLSGGNPAILRRLVTLDPKPAVDEKLMRGALAYVEGRGTEAADLLGGIDARRLPSSLGSQLAMAQAALIVGRDPAKASTLLDTARLLSPGTLCEEAALRRQILVAASTGQTQKFESLSRQYLGRFRTSVYAGNFRKRFAAALTRMDFMNDEQGFRRLDVLISELDAASKQELYLMIARAAIIEGKTAAVDLAATRALTMPAPPSDEARARLYKAAALTVAPEGPEASLAELKRIDRDALPPSETGLYLAATNVANAIRTATDPASASTGFPAGDPAAPPQSAAVARAEKTLEIVDALLKDAPL